MSSKRLLVAAVLTAAAAHAEPPATGSLWSGGRLASVSLVSDRTAAQPGDLVTIVVRLQTTASRNQSTQADRSNTLDEQLLQLFFTERTQATGDQAFNFYRSGGETPRFRWEGERSFEGGGAITQRETLATSIQALVVAVQPNGVLQLEARRTYASGGETSELLLTGLARPADITRANTIDSDRVAELQVVQVGDGPLTRDQRRGWLTRIFETVNPF